MKQSQKLAVLNKLSDDEFHSFALEFVQNKIDAVTPRALANVLADHVQDAVLHSEAVTREDGRYTIITLDKGDIVIRIATERFGEDLKQQVFECLSRN